MFLAICECKHLRKDRTFMQSLLKDKSSACGKDNKLKRPLTLLSPFTDFAEQKPGLLAGSVPQYSYQDLTWIL